MFVFFSLLLITVYIFSINLYSHYDIGRHPVSDTHDGRIVMDKRKTNIVRIIQWCTINIIILERDALIIGQVNGNVEPYLTSFHILHGYLCNYDNTLCYICFIAINIKFNVFSYSVLIMWIVFFIFYHYWFFFFMNSKSFYFQRSCRNIFFFF